ncbi:MAG: 16S rRNA (adenine(1518)-N(6)/adenine(1519)-N(6))-dimethyltransferase RsmA [Erysipelotrichaceae bacterium]
MNTIATISETKRLLAQYDYGAKKKYGQNFLVSANVVENILTYVDKQTTVIEIGPGLGAISQLACLKAKEVFAYEIDPDLCAVLKDNIEFDNFHLENVDFLTVDLEKLLSEISGKKVIVSNLPYYITSKLLTKVILQWPNYDCLIAMMQKEVANRFINKADKKQINQLQILSQLCCQCRIICQVNKNNFIPAPNVDSTVLLFENKKIDFDINLKDFYQFLDSCFSQRRKPVYTNLINAGYNIKQREAYKMKRVEQMSLADYLVLYGDVEK